MLKSLWQNHSALILDKISMISLKLLGMIFMRLSQTKIKINNDITVLNDLSLVIVIGDFYQFFFVTKTSI